ncbi:unnamed protein product [Cuscuta europaea]|uniref:Ribosomal RNA-processing protein 12-like conserved domain-containing protein n=1 Tax=Cuscuta europaea TaxID=41803 RepID=A0A9P0YK20_CUSEU|nr:unnamed protein product [Cuscuta europaea]
MENQGQLPDTAFFNEKSDICQQLFSRYGKSSAVQHRHLCATAAATKSIIQSESLPLTPFSYFAATVSTLADSPELDSDAVAALSSFLSIVLPLVPEKAIPPPKATEAVEMLEAVLEKLPRDEAVVGSSSVRALVKCIGILLGFCNLEVWDSVRLGLQTLLKFSIDRRPKVRKCALDCALTVMKSLQSSSMIKRASKKLYSFMEGHLSLAIKMTTPEAVDGFKNDSISKPEHQELYHTFNLMKTITPYLSVEVCKKILPHLLNLMSSHNSDLTRHVFDNIGVILSSPKVKLVAQDSENILKLLVSYMTCLENPTDNRLVAATLTERVMKKLHDGEVNGCCSHLDFVIRSITGLLTCKATGLPASLILQELIKVHLDNEKLSSTKIQMVDDKAINSPELAIVKSICAVFYDILRTSDGIPNEHILRTISVLFLKLGKISYFSMKDILLQLAAWMNVSCVNESSGTKHLQECIGYATISMSPDKLLALLPISLNVKDYSCSNTWLIPILSKYVRRSSLGFFMEHIVPLAESFQQASFKVKKSVIRQELQAYAHDCWGLMVAFCRGPTDICQNFNALSKMLVPFLKKDSIMLEAIATSLKNLVNQNKKIATKCDFPGSIGVLDDGEIDNFAIELIKKSAYSTKIAQKNIEAISACSEGLLQALTDFLIDSYPETHEYLKEAIECLSSISDSATTKRVGTSILEKFGLAAGYNACEVRLDGSDCINPDQGKVNATPFPEFSKRLMILELALCIIGGSNEDLILTIFSIIKRCLEANDGIFQAEAYNTLSRMLERHHWFRSSYFAQSLELLSTFKSPADIKSLTSRFACYKTLLIHAIKENLDEENTQAFVILNEIILALKESNEESRKAAYDVLTKICSYMRKSSSVMPQESYKNFITMVMGYLSGPSPQIKSGAISALSVLIYNDSDIWKLVPDLVPSVLALLQSKGVEIVKAVLGFVKVLVSSLQSDDLKMLLPDIVNGVLPWSVTSRHHFRSKVSVVMEILARKCGTGTIKSIASEKYKNFLKTVFDNRHGKTSAKEAANSSASFKGEGKSGGHGDSESSQSSKKRKWENRQKDVTDNIPKEDEKAFMEPRKRKKSTADLSRSKRKKFSGSSITSSKVAKRGEGKWVPAKHETRNSKEKKNPSQGSGSRTHYKKVQKKRQ